MTRCSSRVASSPIGALVVPLERRGLHDAQIELVCDEDRAVRVRGEDLNRVMCLALDLCQMSAAAASVGVRIPRAAAISKALAQKRERSQSAQTEYAVQMVSPRRPTTLPPPRSGRNPPFPPVMTVTQLEVARDFERWRCRAEVELHRFHLPLSTVGPTAGWPRAGPENPAQHSHTT